MKIAWLKRTMKDLVLVALGYGRNGIPGGLVTFDYRIKWLRNAPVLSCRCEACNARRTLIFPLRRMAIHVQRTHVRQCG